MNSSSSNQRAKEKLAELIAKAQTNLKARGIIVTPPTLSKIIEPLNISTPKDSQADIESQFNEAKLRASASFREEKQKLLDEANAKLAAELEAIEATRPKLDWNAEQSEAIKLSSQETSFCLIGKAGTGKTTVTREIIRQLVKSGKVGPITTATKYLVGGLPGIAVVSFTNRAVKNIARGMSGDMKAHCLTVHKLLEFAPKFIDITQANGEVKVVKRFLPQRNSLNPLPVSLKCIIFEESSMISTELFQLLMDALPNEIQMIFLGDLQQLPPVYGTAILGFKLLELPVVELTRIYRQAEGSPIIGVAWKIASGEKLPSGVMTKIANDSGGKIVYRPWKKRLEADSALHIMNILFKQFIDAKVYDPKEDMIMIPFNKSFGTVEFNRNLAQHLGKLRNAVVYEIIAGFNKLYYAVGDKVLVDRQEAIIEQINFNDMYKGMMPLKASEKLNRWGMYEVESKAEHETTQADLDDVEKFLLMQSTKMDDEEAKQQGSHILVCRILDSDEIREVRTTGEYSSCIFAYALTVHKCQGSEWRKCFLILHHSHAMMISRELLYTAVTRAREELIILCEPDSIEKGVRNQRIKGNTIAEKAEFFKGKLEKEM